MLSVKQDLFFAALTGVVDMHLQWKTIGQQRIDNFLETLSFYQNITAQSVQRDT